MTCTVARFRPPPSRWSEPARHLLSLFPGELANAESDVAKRVREVLERANYRAGLVYLIALQGRAEAEPNSADWMHWSGVVGAARRVVQGHITETWPKDDAR